MGAARTHLITLTLGAVLGLFCSSVGASLEVRGKVEGAVELECSVPPPDTPAAASLHVVEWVRQGLDIPVLIQFGAYAPRVHPSYEGRVSLVGDTALRVEALQLEDRGAYLCRILLLNNSTDGLLNGTWTLVSVTAPPTFTKTPLPVLETLVGNRLSLTCAANGNPTPTIIWLKDGAAIQDKNIQSIVHNLHHQPQRTSINFFTGMWSSPPVVLEKIQFHRHIHIQICCLKCSPRPG